MHDVKIRKEAVRLRGDGKTYDEISNILNISKSTASLWLRDLPFPDKSNTEAKKQYFLTHVQSKGARANKLKKELMWQRLTSEAQLAVKSHDYDDSILFSILSILYWAEGTKYDRGGVVFTNTDPKLSYLFLELLRKTVQLDEKRLRVRLHLHYYHKKRETVRYWSELLKIPPEQFQSTYIKKRSSKKRFRHNFMGICFIKYGDTQIRRKILSYAYALQEQLAPVAQLD